ncbi:extensin family protein [Actibacterium sp. 188UL27-1]|uniref:extensin-like domain-containing protein n=1 Tax=Actibacterium sp. 188UL27-1 TaxID=2786961 RepID=UPI0019594E4C|nr:extensin family protein [Actibacterium sp. 188UL27-1]MBM7066079.1 extensin family protein [Actibacterium sp. 188UL27-1]
MSFRTFAGFLLAVSLSHAAWADAPERSLVPESRPGTAVEGRATVGVAQAVRNLVNPSRRASAERQGLQASRAARVSPPKERPRGLKRRFQRLVGGQRSQPGTVTQSKKGSVCGIRSIRGQTIAPIPGRIKGCGVADPVKVTSVAGVALSTAITVDCITAQALNSWVENGVKPAVGRAGGGVASLKIAAHYSCRTRNNRPGAKISEHGRGRAVDISAINLKNGASLTVSNGWRDKKAGPILKKAHSAACGPFGTVLGPDADRYHQDHFHFDTARYRNGTYCR